VNVLSNASAAFARFTEIQDTGLNDSSSTSSVLARTYSVQIIVCQNIENADVFVDFNEIFFRDDLFSEIIFIRSSYIFLKAISRRFLKHSTRYWFSIFQLMVSRIFLPFF